MEFDSYYVVILKKGPNWTGQSTPELEALQQRHLAHLGKLYQQGLNLISGPVQDHGELDRRGISIYRFDAFPSLDALRAKVEADPMFEIGHLDADYMTWHVPRGSSLELGDRHG